MLLRGAPTPSGTKPARATYGSAGKAGAQVWTDVDALQTTIGVAGAGLTALGDTRLANLDAAISTRSTYAGADTAGTTTLLGIFSGIASLPMVRGLFRKDAMDATALSEVNTGGGTFSETTDSLEAIRDTAPLGTAMRGTDGAYTGTPPSTADIKTALEADGSKLDHLWEITRMTVGYAGLPRTPWSKRPRAAHRRRTLPTRYSTKRRTRIPAS